MRNPEPKPFRWMKPADMIELGRKLGAHNFGCYTEIMMKTAEANGIIDHEAAVALLARIPKMTDERARESIAALVSAGLVKRDGETLTLTAFGTSVMPDYDDWEPRSL